MEPIKYVRSLLTFYLKGEIHIEQNFITFKIPNTILGLIPFGAKEEKIAVNQVVSVSSNFKLKLGKLIIGIIFAFLSFSFLFEEGFFSDGLFGGFILMLIVSANFILDAYEIDLQLNMASGQTKLVDFFLFDKTKAKLAEERINAIINSRLNDTNNRQQTDRILEVYKNK